MVYVLLVDGFEEIEAVTPIDILRRCGVEVKTVGVEKRTVTGSHNIPVTADMEIGDINREDIELLMLPGGPGHTILDKSEEVRELIDYCVGKGKYVSAICAAPSILGKRGYLEGKKATCFPGFEEQMKGAHLTGDKVAADGIFITGKGAGAAAEFGFAMAELLAGRGNAQEIRAAMQY